ncbi:DUF3105 domain-containing protein [Glycomyces sp. L485]|uniref:DUF3105 domain-containing protein n=1 Tax=Glycomyces sp. L485 TaxID=2909235 RepID=UPI001F4ADE76|nr:DUF3105 domain-containing protein [Glycomyces sp. L485]
MVEVFHEPARARPKKRAGVIAAAGAALALAGGAYLLIGGDEGGPEGVERIEGLQTVDVSGAGDHTTETVEYRLRPPAGGPHHPVWQNCGFYSEPIKDEHAVHAMEHGTVWIAYAPELDADSVERIGVAVRDHMYVLASPYPGVEGTVMSAWGYRLELDGVDDPRFADFIGLFAGSRHVPEAGGPCHGGTGTPE